MLNYVKDVLENIPADWLNLTTHRLDIYEEELAKTQFLEQFEVLFQNGDASTSALKGLPTAFDYIRLGHPLSCLLEWVVADLNQVKPENVISFSSSTMPVLAILRTNLQANKNTRILYTGELSDFFDVEVLKQVYGYQFELKQVEQLEKVAAFDGSSIFISRQSDIRKVDVVEGVDFFVRIHDGLGSVLIINGDQHEDYVSAIQHVRRRETIAMTPVNCYSMLSLLVDKPVVDHDKAMAKANKVLVLDLVKENAGTSTQALLGSSGLSIQYAIWMGLIHDALENHPGKDIKIVVPPNCYGGTNDQARRVAACLDNVEIVDLPVDGDDDMVRSIDHVLADIAEQDAVPYIIAEIPTNPRVEVPDLEQLKQVLSQERTTRSGESAIVPVFILDQTFCPNVQFLGEGGMLSTVRTISFSSGSKFPSGGLCTAGYCIGNKQTEALMEKIALHLQLCDNEATDFQVEVLAQQLPSMKQRIAGAYKNTREFVDFIQRNLPAAKINFVSEELAKEGFTPSVFSLDLPTKGNTDAEKEAYKRALNYQLINLMISEIPDESKNCVSYGQLKGCYWTIPATSTQGTTKEGDKDYIVRVALSPDMDLARHKEVFLDFAGGI